jgi:hypothetical protein
MRQTGATKALTVRRVQVADPGKVKKDRIDPAWPQVRDGSHPVSELTADRQGALSPYGDLSFPMSADSVPYRHPVTEINK